MQVIHLSINGLGDGGIFVECDKWDYSDGKMLHVHEIQSLYDFVTILHLAISTFSLGLVNKFTCWTIHHAYIF